MGDIDDALHRANANTATKPLPKSAQAQMRFLLKAGKGSTRSLAARLGVAQRTVERYVEGTLPRPRTGRRRQRAAAAGHHRRRPAGDLLQGPRPPRPRPRSGVPDIDYVELDF